MATEQDFQNFQRRIDEELLTHPVITNNEYCRWFENADLTTDEVRHFAVQFSVFSNQFLIAQLKKMINAVDLQDMRAAKEILANEIGCIYNRQSKEAAKEIAPEDYDDQGNPELVSTEGTVDGGTFRFKAAHFEWLLRFGEPLGLTFDDMGKRKHGSKATLYFCDELIRIYGSENFIESVGAGYAVENWAAAGFWKQLIGGLRRFKENHLAGLPLAFFTWHDRVEDQHAAHTQDELRELYFGPHPFDEERFIEAGNEMLDGVAAFWDGLNEHRLAADK
jgi:hypothetical protein